MLNIIAIFILIILMAGIPATIYRYYRPRIKGAIGESSVASILARLPKSKYKVINNLVLASDDKISQIDHVVISNYGLFVVETKNLKGWILGHENSQYWTQVIYHRKERFYNPIRQNRGHISALKTVLNGFPAIKYIPILAFADKAELKVEVSSEVVYYSELLRTIKRYEDSTLSEYQRDRIFDRLTSLNISETYNRKAHIASIKRRVEKRETLLDQDICPQCGGELVPREGKFGEFLGCSRYPVCKFYTSD